MRKFLFCAVTVLALGAATAANAASERTLSGAAIGAGTGALVAGPIGAVAGGVVGAVVGGPRLDAGLMAISGRTSTTKAMGKGSTQFQHTIQIEVPPKVLTEWIGPWREHHGIGEDLRVQLRPHTPGSQILELAVLNEKGEKELITCPLDGSILPGVTRKSILELTRTWGEFKVTEGNFTMADLIKVRFDVCCECV